MTTIIIYTTNTICYISCSINANSHKPIKYGLISHICKSVYWINLGCHAKERDIDRLNKESNTRQDGVICWKCHCFSLNDDVIVVQLDNLANISGYEGINEDGSPQRLKQAAWQQQTHRVLHTHLTHIHTHTPLTHTWRASPVPCPAVTPVHHWRSPSWPSDLQDYRASPRAPAAMSCPVRRERERERDVLDPPAGRDGSLGSVQLHISKTASVGHLYVCVLLLKQ